MRPTLFAALLLCTPVGFVCALDVVGEAPYLDQAFRADWHATPLTTVLKDLGKQIAHPVQRSGGVLPMSDARQVTLVDARKTTVRATLELLERLHELHFTAEALTLRVETWEDYRDRRRHPVNLALRDYGLFLAVPDFPGSALGFGFPDPAARAATAGFSIFGADAVSHDRGNGPDLSALVDWIRTKSSDGGIELRGHGNAFLLVTDEEEVAIRQALDEQQRLLLERTAWRMTSGLLPAGEALPTGLVAQEAAAALGRRLKSPCLLTLSAINGQRVNARSGRQQSLSDDIDIVNYQLDPRMGVISTGRAADLRPTLGSQFVRLAYHLCWVDPQAMPVSTVLNPARSKDGTATSSSKHDKDGKESEVSVSSTGAEYRPEVAVAITRPVLWSWMPQGDVHLPPGQALVLASEHPAGTAVMIVERLP